MVDNYGLVIVTAPTSEPLSLDQVRSHLRLNAVDQDDLTLTAYLTAAREYVETVTHRQLVQAQYKMVLVQFPGRRVDEYRPPGWRYGVIKVPRPPLISVDLLQYIDTNQALQTIAPYIQGVTNLNGPEYLYQVSTTFEPGRVLPAPFKVWPVSDPYTHDAVFLTFTCGYATIPERLLQCVRYVIGHLYEHREASVERALSMVPYGLETFVRSASYGEVN